MELIKEHLEEIKEKYQEYYKELQEYDTSDKQASSMCCILTADYISSKYIFQDEALETKDVIQYLKSNEEININERAYKWILNWIGRNRNHFIQGTITPSNGEIWGEVKETEPNIIKIDKDVLTKEMNKEGLSFDSVKKFLHEKKVLIKNTQGKYFHNTSLDGYQTNIVKLRVPLNLIDSNSDIIEINQIEESEPASIEEAGMPF